MQHAQHTMAQLEFGRLKAARAWSPCHTGYARKRINQYVARYAFQDGSVLTIWTNGDAAWRTHDGSKMICRISHHQCNTQGK